MAELGANLSIAKENVLGQSVFKLQQVSEYTIYVSNYAVLFFFLN